MQFHQNSHLADSQILFEEVDYHLKISMQLMFLKQSNKIYLLINLVLQHINFHQIIQS